MSKSNVTRKYIFFGEYPQTLKADDVEITDCVDGYWLGSDGERYVKKIATNLNSDLGLPKPHFSNGSEVVNNQEYFFKVEPLRWMVLTEDGETALLLCDKVISRMQFCWIPCHTELDCFTEPDQVYGSRVLGSHNGCTAIEILSPAGEFVNVSYERHYLNDGFDRIVYSNYYYFSDVRRWLNEMFYNKAFNYEQKKRIVTVDVNNNAAMSKPYDCPQWG